MPNFQHKYLGAQDCLSIQKVVDKAISAFNYVEVEVEVDAVLGNNISAIIDPILVQALQLGFWDQQ